MYWSHLCIVSLIDVFVKISVSSTELPVSCCILWVIDDIYCCVYKIGKIGSMTDDVVYLCVSIVLPWCCMSSLMSNSNVLINRLAKNRSDDPYGVIIVIIPKGAFCWNGGCDGCVIVYA